MFRPDRSETLGISNHPIFNLESATLSTEKTTDRCRCRCDTEKSRACEWHVGLDAVEQCVCTQSHILVAVSFVAPRAQLQLETAKFPPFLLLNNTCTARLQ